MAELLEPYTVAIFCISVSHVGLIRSSRDSTGLAYRAFCYFNFLVFLLSSRRFRLSPPGSAAARTARLAMLIHIAAILVHSSFMMSLYGANKTWVVFAVTVVFFYKLGAIDDEWW